MSWDPQVEQRPHPFGEAGVRSSLEEVCKRAAEGASELLGNPKHLARVRTYAGKKLKEAQQRGEEISRPGDRARILLKVVQNEKIWMPDPIGIEYIPKAHLMACDGDTHEDGTPCVQAEDCDGKTVLLAALYMSVGLYTMIVGHSYTKDGVIGHVLVKVYFDGKWHYADVSPLGNGKYMELGKSAPFTRERYYSMPTIKVVCDAASCDVRNFDPQELGFVQQGTFVGVNGIAVMEMPPVVEWLGAPVVEWLGEYKADDALSKEIVARKGDTSEESLKAYGQAAGAMGGGAACLAFGVSAPVAGGCAILGGLIGGVIASMVPVAKGSDLQDAVVDTWKSWTAPNLKWSQRALLAVKAYYVMREEAVDAAVAAGATASWAEGYLVQHGLTKEPTPGRWAPRPERYNHPLVCTVEPCASAQSVVSASDWKECGAAKSVGINLECRTYLQLTYGPWPPVAGKNDEVDWGLVGWDEIAVERDMKQKYKETGCNMNANGTMIPITCPSVKPSAWARESVIKLKLVQAKMLVEAKGSGGALEYRSMSSAPAKSKGAVIVGGLSAAAGLAWWVWSKGLLK